MRARAIAAMTLRGSKCPSAPMVLVIFTEGKPMSESTQVLPNAVSSAIDIVRDLR